MNRHVVEAERHGTVTHRLGVLRDPTNQEGVTCETEMKRYENVSTVRVFQARKIVVNLQYGTDFKAVIKPYRIQLHFSSILCFSK